MDSSSRMDGAYLETDCYGQNEAQVDREGKDEDGHEGEREGRVDGTAQTGSVCEGELCDGCGGRDCLGRAWCSTPTAGSLG
jgi:hypothetical protein